MRPSRGPCGDVARYRKALRTVLQGAGLPVAGAWAGLGLLPWRPWSTRERLEPEPGAIRPDLSSVTALLPARNEAATIGRTLQALAAQGWGLRIIAIDDQSTDGTAERARAAVPENLTVIQGAPLPAGWSGKLWALHQGLARVQSPLVLLLDADIELLPGTLAALIRKLEVEKRDLVSVMAELRAQSAWEKLLVPAFVYFFKLLYPFAIGNRPGTKLGVAAGGCILLRTDRLRAVGGFAALRDALIDDCTLAKEVKRSGGSTWVGLSHAVKSRRSYGRLAEFWRMVERTAFTQLDYSPFLLAGTTAAMLALFGVPWAGLIFGRRSTRLLGLAAVGTMAATYIPVIRFYRLPWWRIFTLSGASFLYLLMTWSSAWRYWHGQRSEWKGRVYGR
jgi:hopene-associated glycosyltransferase HpnB